MRVAMKLHPVILPLTTEEQGLRGRARLQAQSQRAREALARSCEASGVRLGPLEKGDRNTPLPFQGTFWSLSHKPRFVAAVVGPATIGIDIEEITPRTEGLLDYIARKAEWALAGRTWEAYFRFQNHIVSLTHEGHEIAWNLVLEPHALDDSVPIPPQPQA